jgi:serine/alanine adding enzyme
MTILIDQEISKESWKQFYEQHPQRSPFQSPDYYELFNSIPQQSARAFAVSSQKEIKALVVIAVHQEKGIKGFFSRRAIIYGGPLLSDLESAQLLLNTIEKYLKGKVIYIETRNAYDFSNFTTIFHDCGWKFSPWLNYIMDIQTADSIAKNMSASRMRQIKKAQKSGVTWEIANDIESVKIFYNLLCELYEKKIKKPLMPWIFFEKFFKLKLGLYLVVKYNNQIIGGIMCPILKNERIYEWYICGMDQEFRESYPSVMATWAAIAYGLENNIPVFDFMGAGSPDDQYGVRDFKARFGGEEVNHGRYIKIMNPSLYQLGKWGLFLLSKLK